MTHNTTSTLTTPVGGALPIPQKFEHIEDERNARKKSLSQALRVFGRLGMCEGAAGHITIRDPEFGDRLWVNPFAKHFSKVYPEDLICVNDQGEVVEGNGPVNGAAVAIHCGIHRTCADVVSVVHTHTTFGRAFSCLKKEILPINQEACVYFENQVLFQGDIIVLNLDEGDRIGQVMGSKKNVIMENHGLLTAASSVEAAAFRFLALERCCQIQLVAEAAGKVHSLSIEEARIVKSQIGSDYLAWLGFRGLVSAYLDED